MSNFNRHIGFTFLLILLCATWASAQPRDVNCSEQAQKLVDRAWAAQPMNKQQRGGTPSKAEELYKQAIVDSPRCPRASRLLVALLMRSERYEEARKYNDRFLQDFPDDPGALTQRASLISELNKDYQSALDIEKKLLDATEFNHNGNVYYRIAAIYSLMNRLDDSLDYLAQALRVDKSWGDKENAQADSGFENLRKDKRFWVLIKK